MFGGGGLFEFVYPMYRWKKLLCKEIIKRFSKEGFTKYVEVFGGEGWVLFDKGQSKKQLEVFNDIDGNSINLYRCIKFHADAVQKELDWILSSREVFTDYKTVIDSNIGTDIQKAAMYLYLVKVSYGADCRAYGAKTGINNTKEILLEIQKRLSAVIIENKSYEKIIKNYDSANTLFYLDTPYYKAERYYDSQFTEEDHKELARILKGIRGRFILSYNNGPYIKELYKGLYIEEIERNNNLSNKNGKYKELIIRNYKCQKKLRIT